MSDSTESTIETAAGVDFVAFEARENALATGQDAPQVAEPEPETPPAGDAEPEPDAKAAPIAADGKAYTPPNSRSKRTAKDQEFINERIRTAVQEATDRLRAELAPKSVEPAKAEPKAPAKFTYESFDEHLAAHPTDALAYHEWEIERLEAWTEWKRAAAESKAKAEQHETAAKAEEARLASLEASWPTRRDAFAATSPGYDEATRSLLSGLQAGTMIGDALLESEVGPQMALHLATHPDEVARILALPVNSAVRALGKIEAMFESPTTSASASAGPAAKKSTTAPAPPTTLAARSASPADRSRDASDRGDYPAFEAEENRKAIAASR